MRLRRWNGSVLTLAGLQSHEISDIDYRFAETPKALAEWASPS